MQVSISEINGQHLALVMWYLDRNQDQKAVLLFGTLKVRETELSLHRDNLPPFTFPRRLLSRIRKVPRDLAETLRHCSYCLQMTAGDLPARKLEENFSAWLPEKL